MRKILAYAPMALVAIAAAHPASAQLVDPDIGGTGYDMTNVNSAATNAGKVVTASVLTVGATLIAPRIARMAVRWVKGGIN